MCHLFANFVPKMKIDRLLRLKSPFYCQNFAFLNGGSLLKWFSSYLTGRRQRVTVLGATSNTLPISSGVPQGSILGPVLFLLYVNDLPDSVTTSKVAMFADDTKLLKRDIDR
jgi:hypothetical protein